MEINETPKPKISPPDLNNLTGYIKTNQAHIRLDASYNHLPPEQALRKMGQQAQLIIDDFRVMGKPDPEIQSLVAEYLLGPDQDSTSERK